MTGFNFAYVIGVTNYGPSTSSNVVVSDTLPFGFTVISTANSKGSVSGLNWNVGTLATGAGAQLTLTVRANSYGSNLLNYATSSSDTPDPNPADDTASIGVNVGVTQPPQFGSFSSSNGVFRLTVASPAASTIIQASTNLVNWVNVFTSTPPFTFTDSNATNYSSRFYRALLGP
jgi:uncharacterized repeat protein (TIGR01451 family)